MYMRGITDKHATYPPQQMELTRAPIFPSTHTELQDQDHTPSKDFHNLEHKGDMLWNCPGLAFRD